MNTYANIDEYIAKFPEHTQQLLKQIRTTIHRAAPKAEEAIKYGIPTFVLKGKNLVHFGGYTQHIGFYPAPRAIEEFKQELAGYKGGKGTVQFPIGEKLPLVLISRMVKWRVENK